MDGNVASQWISDLESQLDPNAHYLCFDALAAIEFATLHFTTDFPPNIGGAAPVGGDPEQGDWVIFNSQHFQLGFSDYHRDLILHEGFHLIGFYHEDIGGPGEDAEENFQEWISSVCFGRGTAGLPA